jgi:hypothetical protein
MSWVVKLAGAICCQDFATAAEPGHPKRRQAGDPAWLRRLA